MAKEYCENCRFWVKQPNMIVQDQPQGMCRKDPPVMYPIPGPGGVPGTISVTPTSQANHWCGTWSPKPSEIQ